MKIFNKMMKWFNKRSVWVRGGVAGIGVCILLFVFYAGIYFPIIDQLTSCDESPLSSYCLGPPAWTTTIPIITGHFFVVYGHFIIEGSSVTNMFCEATESHCIEWNLEQGCTVYELTPTEACRDAVENSGIISIVVLLIAIYFAIGAVIALKLNKK